MLNFGADLLQTNPLPHLLKLGLAQGLSENVCKLISGWNVFGLDASIFQAASDEVVLDPDMLAPFMEDWVLGQSEG